MAAICAGQLLIPIEEAMRRLDASGRRWVRRQEVASALAADLRPAPLQLVDSALRVLVRRGFLSMRLDGEGFLLYALCAGPPLPTERASRLLHG